jgi:ADP-heptose:LPS heptosyltransferase
MTSRFDHSGYKKFLVVQTASIGDVILATPVIEKIHAFYPDGTIDFLLKKGTESLFEGHPFIRRLIIWDKSVKKYTNFFTVCREVRKSRYDVVINLQRFASSGFLTVISGALYKAGFNKNPFSIFFSYRAKHLIKSGGIHEIQRNLSLIEPITDSSQVLPVLYPGANHAALMSQYKTVKYITVSPASLWFTKQYPAEKWIEFVRKVDPHTRIYFLGSKKDYHICEMIVLGAGHENSMILAGKISLLEAAVLMKDASMNYMNDSAPVHLASAVNAPTTAVFCSTVPGFGFGPLAKDSVVVQTQETLACRPCGLHGLKKCPEKHFKCALTIDPEELLKRSL